MEPLLAEWRAVNASSGSLGQKKLPLTHEPARS